MSTIPTNLARVPNFLASQIMLASIQNSNQRLLQTQVQISTGKAVNRPSDNVVAASSIGVLDDLLERRDQRLKNLSHADAVLNTADGALAEASDNLLQAKEVGLGQIGVGSDADTRKTEARVIDGILNSLLQTANSKYQDLYLFGGTSTARQPMVDLLGGLRYTGQGEGLITDSGLNSTGRITTSGEEVFGSLSARVQGSADLDPQLTGSTRLLDLNGARGLGVTLGTINVDVGGTDVSVDLSDAATADDVITALQTAIQTVDAGATVSIDAGTGNRFAIAGNTVAITISDLGADGAAADLGLTGTYAIAGGTGQDIDPKLTERTSLSSLTGVTVPLGTIRLANGGQTRDLDLSSAQTVQDVMNAVAGLNIGIRVEVADTADRLNFINELSGGQMSIGEVAGGTTATELGVRSFTGSTLLSDFNNGRGVSIATGGVDPVSGLPDPTRDVDFTISLKDGTSFDVDLEDVATVQDVLDQINAAATTAGLAVPADFEAALATDGNGITLTDNTVGANPTAVTAQNNSQAADDLGILGSTTSATLAGEDRATVAVDSLFSHLIALRDALDADDSRGINFAVQGLDTDIARLAEARADIGVRAKRVSDAITHEQDLMIQDKSLKSNLQDLDMTEAAVRFSTLQQQLQAGLITTTKASSLSLLDFLQ
ncbi:MAG TPA: flagellin [Phycisphaerales bacterium]|nr:flagellin [Phycisphaerales bacterium]